jgi:hypothetical protein
MSHRGPKSARFDSWREHFLRESTVVHGCIG